eukprot:3568160-Rhodomonas_salina.1
MVLGIGEEDVQTLYRANELLVCSPMPLRARYAMHAYALATQYAVLAERIRLRACYAMSGTDTAYAHTRLASWRGHRSREEEEEEEREGGSGAWRGVLKMRLYWRPFLSVTRA